MSFPAGPSLRPDVLRVGLTGGIATGKSVVGEVFRQEGAFLLDADALGHLVMEPGRKAHEEILATFGREVLAPDGRVDRKRLGARIFSDEAARKRLNAILHPRILEEVENRLREFARRAQGGIAVVEAALVVEAGARFRFHRIVVTHCEPEIQVRRLMERDSISETEARRRVASQAAPGERLAAADQVIDTSGSLAQTRLRAKTVFGILRSEWESGRPGN